MMGRIPTLHEVERRHILNTLHLCGNNRTLTARVLGMSVRGLRIKLHQYERAGFAIAVPSAGNEICGELDIGGPTQRRDSPEHEAVTINVVEELMSVVDAITERARPDDAKCGEMTRRKEKT
jgi:hypothetical protein